MRWVAVTALVLVLGASLAISYLVYRQLDTKTVTITDTAQLQPNGAGALCGSLSFSLDPRTLGRWLFPIKVGQQVSGDVTVDGSEAEDIGVRVWSPSNRLLLNRPVPQHSQQFQLVAPARGDYLFEFDNRHSALTAKRITIALCLA